MYNKDQYIYFTRRVFCLPVQDSIVDLKFLPVLKNGQRPGIHPKPLPPGRTLSPDNEWLDAGDSRILKLVTLQLI